MAASCGPTSDTASPWASWALSPSFVLLLHHGAHLQVLLEDRVNVLNRCAAAFGDALTALAVNNVMVAALFVGHRIDDGLHLLAFFLIHLRIFGKFGERAHFREHVHNLLERAHLAYLLQLIAKIFKREFFLAQFAFEFGGGFLVHGLLGAFD